MTASQDRWVCPVCEQRFLYLSELVDHVETRHPADNVTVLEPVARPTDHEEADPDVATGRTADLDREAEEPLTGGPASGPRGPSGLEPFDDFRSAARAVMEEVARGADREVSTLLMRLLGTVLAAEARAEETSGGGDASTEQGTETRVDVGDDLGGRRTWMDTLAAEEDRCRRHGMRASVLVVRFGGREEDVVQRAASAVSGQTRAHDKVVRLRDDALAVLAAHCSEADADVLAERVLEALQTERIPVQTAVGSRGHRVDLYGAWEEAERRLENHPPPGSASG